MLVSSIISPAKTFTSVPCAQNWFRTLQWFAVGPDLLESSSSELAHITSRQINYRWVFMPIEATSLPPSVPCNFPISYYTSDLEMKLICKAFVNTKIYVYYTQNLWRFILEFDVHGSVHLGNVCSIKVPIRCTFYMYFIPHYFSSTCFGCYCTHPQEHNCSFQP
jgi:hypothetical protein